jgi:hypothetical protein
MLKPNDILITETGTSSVGLGYVNLPKGGNFQNRSRWGSTGRKDFSFVEALLPPALPFSASGDTLTATSSGQIT